MGSDAGSLKGTFKGVYSDSIRVWGLGSIFILWELISGVISPRLIWVISIVTLLITLPMNLQVERFCLKGPST